jgi:hypothetical protein
MIKMRFIVLVIILMAFTFEGKSQFYDREWQISLSGYIVDTTLATNAVYSFNTGIDTSSLIRPMSFGFTSVTMSDINGDLQFYTNGIWIANRNHDTLLNGSNYNPGWASTYYSPWGMGLMQMVSALPFPDSTEKYIILNTTSEVMQHPDTNISIYQPTHLGFSMIDMTLDNGLGGITGIKDSTLFSDTLINGRLVACRHGNGRDWWVITSKYNSNTRYVVMVTSDGPQFYSTQPIGQPTPDVLDYYGQACFSPDGTKYAIALARTRSVELFDFDRCTGVLSNPRFVYINDSTAGMLGVSFSPDSRFLYTSSRLFLYQLDTYATNLGSSMLTVGIYDGYIANFPTYFFYHQLAADGKIYICTLNGDSVLHKIVYPDSLGISCQFNQHSDKLSYVNNHALNNFPNYNLGSLVGSPCDTLTSLSEAILNAPLQLKVFPNPAVSHNISINYTLEQNKTGMLEIMDVTGKVVYWQKLPQWSTMQQIDLSTLVGGLYLVRLRSGIKEATAKLVLIVD